MRVDETFLKYNINFVGSLIDFGAIGVHLGMHVSATHLLSGKKLIKTDSGDVVGMLSGSARSVAFQTVLCILARRGTT